MQTVLQDLRYAWRTMIKARGFSSIAVATLALGIGASAAIASVVNAAYFSRYPLREPERLVRIYGEDRTSGSRQLSFSYPRFQFFRDHQAAFAGFAAANYNGVALEREADTQLVPAAAITSDFLTTFGAEPLVGRFLRRDEESGGGVVVLGERSGGGASTPIHGCSGRRSHSPAPCTRLSGSPPGSRRSGTPTSGCRIRSWSPASAAS
jgi:putative ABC transport system permease protein